MNAAFGQFEWVEPLFTPGAARWRPRIAWNLAAMQIDAMRTHFPSLRLIVNHPGITIWEGDIQPLSTSYTIRVTDQRGIDDGEMIMPFEFPQVTVKAPQLTRRVDDPSRPIPHLYGPDDDLRGVRLCLFYPDGDEWTRYMLLAESVLPWTAEWLFYYEMWHVTGEWGGPEAPHAPVGVPSPLAEMSTDTISAGVRQFDQPCMRTMSYLLARPDLEPSSAHATSDAT